MWSAAWDFTWDSSEVDERRRGLAPCAARLRYPVVVPKADDTVGMVVVVAQHANAGGLEHQMAAERRRSADPPRDEYAQHMSAAENQQVAVECSKARHHLIDPLTDLQDGFAARTTIAEELPLRPLSMDCRGRPALIKSVVPLDQARVGSCQSGKTGKLAGSPRSLQRTCEHMIKFEVFQPRTERSSIFLTLGGKRDIAQPCVLARKTPRGLSVPYEIDVQPFCRTDTAQA
jgi:hypothetical protein